MTPLAATRSPYVVGPAYDWAFFLAAPLVALVLGIVVATSPVAQTPFVFSGADTTFAGFGLGILIHAHLVAVVFRSHANRAVFARHRIRFVLVPCVLFGLLIGSAWLATASLVVATFWDVYHSGAQTFGFARIYDRNVGAPPEIGRRLDFLLNQLLYAGPILAGASLAAHIEELGAFAELDDPLAVALTHVPAHVLSHQGWITRGVVAGGTLFVAFYLATYFRLHRSGYPVSPLKVFLVSSTGLCSIYTWAFDSWGEAFFIMNVFHAVQYLALVWAREGRGLATRWFASRSCPSAWAALVFFGSVFAYGVSVELLDSSYRIPWAATMVVSIMHFWYDGFVWSVRTGAV